MGYQTSYSLIVEEVTNTELDQILEMLDTLGVIDYALDEEFNCFEPCNWYDYEEDMLKVSSAFPRVHFILCGKGSLNEDIWEHHFWAGKSARYDAEIRIHPLNMADLK